MLAVLGGLLLAGVLWVIITGLVARSRLESIRPELRQYRAALVSGDQHGADRIGRRIEAAADSAHQLTSGPAWWVGSHLLGVGTPARTTRDVALVLHRLSHDVFPRVPDILAGVARTDPAGGSTGRLDVAALRDTGVGIEHVHDLVRDAVTALRATPGSWFGPVSGGRRSALDVLGPLDADLARAHRAFGTVVPMLGADRPQRYFVGFMNEAEARSIGGLPGAFAIVTVDDGRIEVEHIGDDTELADVRADVDLGAEYQALYAQDDPAGVIQNSDIGPNFPDAARIWAGMWQARTGQHVDGAIAVDPSALGYLLRATGPAQLPDGTAVTAHNVANLTQSRQYVLYPGYQAAQVAKRKQFLATIAQSVSSRLLSTDSPGDLIAPLRQAVRERRIVVWSDVPARERTLAAAGLGGVLRPGRAPFSGFVVNNAAGGKMDFYLHRSTTYRTSSCAPGRTAIASFTLRNETPDYRLPAYVTYVSGGRPAAAAPGFNRTIVTYYATPGATIRSVTLDGRPQHLVTRTEDSLTTVRTVIDLPARAVRTLKVVVQEPATTGRVQILRQPLVYALHARTIGPSCVAPTSRRGSVGVWPVFVGVLVLLAAAGVVARRRRQVRTAPATGTSAG